MAHISAEIAYEKFLKLGANSSHFVWFLTKLDFFETSRGWVFAYLQRGPVTLFALEPLIPSGKLATEDFSSAWAEVETALQPKISFFVAVPDDFLNLLKKIGRAHV